MLSSGNSLRASTVAIPAMRIRMALRYSSMRAIMPSADELANHPIGDYRQLTRLTSNSYVREETVGEFFDLVPKVHGGGSTQYWGDYHYANATGQVVFWGGSARSGAYCGLASAASINAWSDSAADNGSPCLWRSGRDVGARLWLK